MSPFPWVGKTVLNKSSWSNSSSSSSNPKSKAEMDTKPTVGVLKRLLSLCWWDEPLPGDLCCGILDECTIDGLLITLRGDCCSRLFEKEMELQEVSTNERDEPIREQLFPSTDSSKRKELPASLLLVIQVDVMLWSLFREIVLCQREFEGMWKIRLWEFFGFALWQWLWWVTGFSSLKVPPVSVLSEDSELCSLERDRIYIDRYPRIPYSGEWALDATSTESVQKKNKNVKTFCLW